MPKEQCCHGGESWKLWKEMQLSIKDLETNSQLIISGLGTRDCPWSLSSKVGVGWQYQHCWGFLLNSWIIINLISLGWAIASLSFSVESTLREQHPIKTHRPSWPLGQTSGLYFQLDSWTQRSPYISVLCCCMYKSDDTWFKEKRSSWSESQSLGYTCWKMFIFLTWALHDI